MGSINSYKKIKNTKVLCKKDLNVFLSVKEGRPEAIKLLERLKHWENLQISDVSYIKTQWTLLHLASWYGHSELCKELILLGANINARDAVNLN